jgi:hypothetical protein
MVQAKEYMEIAFLCDVLSKRIAASTETEKTEC